MNDSNGELINRGDRVSLAWLTGDTFIVGYSGSAFISLYCEKDEMPFCFEEGHMVTLVKRGAVSQYELQRVDAKVKPHPAAYYDIQYVRATLRGEKLEEHQ